MRISRLVYHSNYACSIYINLVTKAELFWELFKKLTYHLFQTRADTYSTYFFVIDNT